MNPGKRELKENSPYTQAMLGMLEQSPMWLHSAMLLMVDRLDVLVDEGRSYQVSRVMS